MLHTLSFFLFVSSVYGTCSNGYEDIGNGVCYKTFATPSLRREAETFCEKEGGNLVAPQNAFVNSGIQTGAQNMNNHVWLGLTCSGTTPSSCTFSDGNQVNSSSFTNFAPGHPDPGVGRCVYLSKSGSRSGKWLSGICEEEILGFGCQIKSNPSAPSCGSSYGELNNFCYKALLPTSKTDAESACEAECGYLTSIHSGAENEFVRNISMQMSMDISSMHNFFYYARIGLQVGTNENYEWVDGTTSPQTDYNNFGHSEPALGSCVAMALRDEEVKSGQWINTQCSADMISVCKRAKTTPCISFSATSTQVPSTSSPMGVSTLAPPTCSSTYFLQGSGEIYSPGYPNNYTSGQRCEYLVAAPTGSVVTFSLLKHFNDYNWSPINLYNSILDSIPFQETVEAGIDYYHTYYASTGTTMKITFNSRTSSDNWAGNYSTMNIRQSGCNVGTLKSQGTITSPNYPSPYPSQYDCHYQLETVFGKRITLKFNFVNTEKGDQDYDKITVYDGPSSNYNVLATYSGNYGNISDSYTSTNNQMFVQFTTDVSHAYQGFTADFSSN